MTKENKAITAFIIGACVLMAIALNGCKTIQPITIVRDSIRVEYKLDSVYLLQRDSVFIDRYTKADTVFVVKEKWMTRYKDAIRLQHDTITLTQTQTKVVTEKYIPKWAWWCLITCIALVVGIVVRIIIKIYSRR